MRVLVRNLGDVKATDGICGLLAKVRDLGASRLPGLVPSAETAAAISYLRPREFILYFLDFRVF